MFKIRQWRRVCILYIFWENHFLQKVINHNNKEEESFIKTTTLNYCKRIKRKKFKYLFPNRQQHFLAVEI